MRSAIVPNNHQTMNISKITIGRLYNLGSYEHVRYELTVEIHASESPSEAILGLEHILEALNPKTSTHSRAELERQERDIAGMHELYSNSGPEEFVRRHGHFAGTPEEYIARCETLHAENAAQRDAWEARSAKARKMLDDLGGAAKWKDAKLDWEDNDFDAS